MYNLGLLADSFHSPQSPAVIWKIKISEKSMDANNFVEELKMIRTTMTGNQKISNPTEQYHTPLPTNLYDCKWLQFHVSIILAKAMPSVRLGAARGTILPESPQAQQSEMQNFLVRIMAIFDDHLNNYIDQHNVIIKKNPKLYDRINAIHQVKTFSNKSELNKIRKKRNSISHEISPQQLSWDDISHAANEVEKALIHLNILTLSTSLSLGKIEGSAIKKTETQDEEYQSYISVKINNNQQLCCEYIWKYSYS